jgi:hypothetical protein
MTVPALGLAPVVLAARTGAGRHTSSVDVQLLERVARDDYDQWLSTVLEAGGCVRPIRLSGTVRDVDTATGEIIRELHTEDLPDKAIYVPCRDRRESVCPPCADTYRRDTYQLIRAGLAGGKGTPESVATHPAVFATFTAPSFGPVHARKIMPNGKVARCRPRRKARICAHGRRISCGQRHNENDPMLGHPLCPDCYDYRAAVVWNAYAPELWRRTVIALRRHLDKIGKPYGARIRLSYAKVAEFQRRGLVHFHAIFRLDGADLQHPGRITAPHPVFTADVLSAAIRHVTALAWFATVSHPAKESGWDITWGTQIDPRPITLTSSGELTDCKVAGYLAKYATKSTEPAGLPPSKITAANARLYANPRTHEGRLIQACLQLGSHPHPDLQALRRWAHMLGYRGHFATKSRRYSTTMRALRYARRDWKRRQHPLIASLPDRAVTTLTDLEWAGRGYRTTGDALLALSAAARAREQRRIAREEAFAA